MKNYIYSDLAVEGIAEPGREPGSKREYSEEDHGIAKVFRLDIRNKKLSEKYGRPRGKYVTVSCRRIWQLDGDELSAITGLVAGELRSMIKSMCGKEPDSGFSALVAGLGNSDITPDAIGPQTVKNMTVTRHIGALAPEVFGKLGQCSVSAVVPGVLAQTGIETVELIRGAAESVRPDIIIAVDALAARSCERLAATVQLSDNGISPGSGIGNMRKAINMDSIGVPVLALGVPTVVDSSTLVYDALGKAGIEKVDDELKKVLENGRGFFVSPKESDIICKSVAQMLAAGIDISLGVK